MNEFHSSYAFPADKASTCNNVIIVRRLHYVDVLKHELIHVHTKLYT